MTRSFAAALGLMCLLASPAQSGDKSIIVLDASGSMWGQIGSYTKVEIAREALRMVLTDMDPASEVGLLTYGHREKGNCADIELMVEPAPGTAQAIIDVAASLEFKGKTPLTEAVRQAAIALKYSEEKATVILITDGVETCEADPCALGTELETTGVDFTAHVVGFGLSAEEGAQVACLAENTGGKYIEAKDAAGLQTALKTAVAAPPPEPEPVPQPQALADNVDPVVYLTAAGPEPEERILADAYFSFSPLGADGSVGTDAQTIYGATRGSLPAGKYRMTTTLHQAVVTQDVEIGPDSELSQPLAIMDAGILSLRLVTEPGGEPHSEANWEVRGADDLYDTGYAQVYQVFPAGEMALKAKLGAVETSDSIVITAGAVTDKEIVLSAGVPVFTAFYAAGVAVEQDQTFEVLSANADISGNRTSIATVFGAGAAVELPPGEYVVRASVGAAVAEQPLIVKAGERVEVPVILNAGLAAVTAPNANLVEFFAAKADLQGNRLNAATEYGPDSLVTLVAGDYLIRVTAGYAIGEFPLVVKPGERVELRADVPVGAAHLVVAGARTIEVHDAKPALDGSTKHIHTGYSADETVLLPPGDYLAKAFMADDTVKELPFAVARDQRTEVTGP